METTLEFQSVSGRMTIAKNLRNGHSASKGCFLAYYVYGS
ncbi:hypothetical protein Bsph_3339 [Lysinibacillus sphaericus C3-41]|uniref:Uncharacterized protein n=1 Tax=Lysinibacillus sphaericus (strain C3-41) TaxID=444177 RepID=B1HQV0_LYSSC|nr:hypothetical protein Bsph_3339 [Lysinibacillus sphaericus C3-41]